jgi:hypothetical protein
MWTWPPEYSPFVKPNMEKRGRSRCIRLQGGLCDSMRSLEIKRSPCRRTARSFSRLVVPPSIVARWSTPSVVYASSSVGSVGEATDSHVLWTCGTASYAAAWCLGTERVSMLTTPFWPWLPTSDPSDTDVLVHHRHCRPGCRLSAVSTFRARSFKRHSRRTRLPIATAAVLHRTPDPTEKCKSENGIELPRRLSTLSAVCPATFAKPPARIELTDLDASLISACLEHLEVDRRNTIRSRNARFAALRSLLNYAALKVPTALGTIRAAFRCR